jgi:hypothetical protein
VDQHQQKGGAGQQPDGKGTRVTPHEISGKEKWKDGFKGTHGCILHETGLNQKEIQKYPDGDTGGLSISLILFSTLLCNLF